NSFITSTFLILVASQVIFNRRSDIACYIFSLVQRYIFFSPDNIELCRPVYDIVLNIKGYPVFESIVGIGK
ncbi:MAG: hypothetical protein WCK84_14200, partial [Bacteroidota bacterium]